MFLIPVYSAHLKPREYHIHLKNRCSFKHIRWDVELSPSGPIFSRTASHSLLVLKPLGLECICSDNSSERKTHLIRALSFPTLFPSEESPTTDIPIKCEHVSCAVGKSGSFGWRETQSERRKCCVIVTRSGTVNSQLYQSPPGLNVTQSLKLDPLSTSKSPSIKWHFINLYQSQTKCIPHNCGCSKPWRPLLNLLVSL